MLSLFLSLSLSVVLNGGMMDSFFSFLSFSVSLSFFPSIPLSLLSHSVARFFFRFSTMVDQQALFSLLYAVLVVSGQGRAVQTLETVLLITLKHLGL